MVHTQMELGQEFLNPLNLLLAEHQEIDASQLLKLLQVTQELRHIA